MKVTLESTSKIIDLVINGTAVKARLWEGKTEKGVPCLAFITRIAVKRDADTSEFETRLQEHLAPSAEVVAFPARLIL